MALATFAMITANGGMASATIETMMAASVENRSSTAQDRTNMPMQRVMSAKYQRLSLRDGCGPAGPSGSMSLPATRLRCPAAGRPKRGVAGRAGAAYGCAGLGLVMFICMFDENDVLAGLNEQQQRAVTHQGGPLLVLAGAGTGKTRTLVARAAWLRGAQGVPASRILLLTFTRRAASDMLARAAAGSDNPADRICGGTFHAIAHKIIRQHAESFSLPPQFTILDPGDAADILDVLRPDHGLAEAGQRAPRAAACADIYTRCVTTGRPVSQVVTASFPWCAPFTGQLAGLFRAYTARKRARHLLDFDDLLLLWQAALADPVAGPVLRGMFERGPGRRVPGRQRGPGQHRSAAAAGREAADLRGRRPGHLRVPRRRPGAPAAAGRRLPRAGTSSGWTASGCTTTAAAATTGTGSAS